MIMSPRPARPLEGGDIDAARIAVAQIVGRDPRALDEAGIARAAIRASQRMRRTASLRQCFGARCSSLPGILGYKAINTLDSMIGHRSERHL